MDTVSEVDPAAVRPAIRTVAMLLPGKDSLPDVVYDQAVTLLPDMQRTQAAGIVRRLVNVSPHCWGIHRRKRWWQIMFHFLPAAEVRECYLGQFPPSLTFSQRHQLKRELKRRFNLAEITAAGELSRFAIRNGRPRPKSKFCKCGAWWWARKVTIEKDEKGGVDS